MSDTVGAPTAAKYSLSAIPLAFMPIRFTLPPGRLFVHHHTWLLDSLLTCAFALSSRSHTVGSNATPPTHAHLRRFVPH